MTSNTPDEQPVAPQPMLDRRATATQDPRRARIEALVGARREAASCVGEADALTTAMQEMAAQAGELNRPGPVIEVEEEGS